MSGNLNQVFSGPRQQLGSGIGTGSSKGNIVGIVARFNDRVRIGCNRAKFDQILAGPAKDPCLASDSLQVDQVVAVTSANQGGEHAGSIDLSDSIRLSPGLDGQLPQFTAQGPFKAERESIVEL